MWQKYHTPEKPHSINFTEIAIINTLWLQFQTVAAGLTEMNNGMEHVSLLFQTPCCGCEIIVTKGSGRNGFYF